MPVDAAPHALRPPLVVYTGGTLGMVAGEHGLAPGGDIAARLARALAALPAQRRAALPDHEVLALPAPIDSSAATPREWQRLAGQLAGRLRRHAGIVVLHGT
ncbi:asparaginase domain-containing protein, partial [Halomonas sp. BM-2019]|uniref:asparaginase domain-containing protein n=1 Tax=Halomonas sp. BM-2019 TaxID=2811227 RepID=UPI001B3C1E71